MRLESLLTLYQSTLLPICTVTTVVKLKWQHGGRQYSFSAYVHMKVIINDMPTLTYFKCWMRRLEEADGSCVREGGRGRGLLLISVDDDVV